MMRKLLLILFFTGLYAGGYSQTRVLIFCKTAGYHHASIDTGVEAIRRICAAHRVFADSTTDAGFFVPSKLSKYAAVIFLNTTGDVLNEQQQAAFEKYIRKGKGYVGIHAASDTEYDWPWYGKLVGAWFTSHPKIQEATLHVQDTNFIATKPLPAVWQKTDEWYNFKAIQPDLHILLTVDENSYEGGLNGKMHPISWYHVFDGGRSFYTALGHTESSYSNSLFLKHLWGGIRYAIGP